MTSARSRRSLSKALLGVVAAMLLASCGESTSPSGPQQLQLLGPNGEKTLNVNVGGQVQVTARLADAKGSVLALSAVTFRSRDAAIAQIDASGLITVRGGGPVYVLAEYANGSLVLRDSVKVNGAFLQ